MSDSGKDWLKRKREEDDDGEHSSFDLGDEFCNEVEMQSSVEVMSIGDFEIDDESFGALGEDSFEEIWTEEFNRHNAEDHVLEPDPPYAAYDPGYRGADDKILELVNDFPDLSEYKSKDKRLSLLYETSRDVRNLTKAVPFRVALLGEAGKGKSSTINSFIDEMGLTETGATGKSCTNVVFEYSRPLLWQVDPYAAEVIWYNGAELRNLLRGLVIRYEKYVFRFNPDWDEEERQKKREAARNAVQSLMEMFCDREEFKTAEAVQTILFKSQATRRSEVVSQLVGLAVKNIQSYANSQFQTRVSGMSTLELRKQLAQFIKPRRSEQDGTLLPSLWHFVRRIRVGLQHKRVLEAFTVIDMPGRADRNLFRADKTNTELKTCDGCWVIADIDRVCDNEMVSRMIREAFDKFGFEESGSVGLVCTHVDTNLDDKLLQHLAKIKAPDFELSLCRKWRDASFDLKRQLHALKGQQLSAQKNRRSEISEEINAMEAEIRQIETLKNNHCAKSRALQIGKDAKAAFGDILKDKGALTVVCISNSCYKNLKCLKDEPAPDLDPEATGILKLRTLARETAAPRIENAVEKNLDKCLELRFQVDLYLKHGLGAVGRLSIQFIQTQIEELGPIVRKYGIGMRDSFKLVVIAGLQNRHDEFREAAIAKFDKWLPAMGKGARKDTNSWHPSTFQAFCRHYGDHETKKQGHLSWNDNFLERFKTRFSDLIDNFELDQGKEFANTKERLKSLLDDFLRALKNWTHPGREAFEGVLQVHRNTITRILDDEWRRQKSFFRDQWLAAVKDGRDSYFRVAMTVAYRACRETKGQGTTQRMIAIMREALEARDGKSPFRVVLRGVEDAFEQDSYHDEEIIAQITVVFQDMIQSLSITIEDEFNDRKHRQIIAKELQAWSTKTKTELANLQESLGAAREANSARRPRKTA